MHVCKQFTSNCLIKSAHAKGSAHTSSGRLCSSERYPFPQRCELKSPTSAVCIQTKQTSNLYTGPQQGTRQGLVTVSIYLALLEQPSE